MVGNLKRMVNRSMNNNVSERKSGVKEIPVFPEFREIKLKDKDFFDQMFKEVQPKISDYTFANLFIWRAILQTRISLLYENICVQMRDIHGKNIFTPVIGGIQLKACIDACLNYAKSNWKEVHFDLYTQEELELFKLYYPTAPIQLDRQASDYVYTTTDLINLRGKKYDGKRNHIRHFKEKHEFVYKEMEPKHIAGCKKFLEKWYRQYGAHWEGPLSLRQEIAACKEALENLKVLELRGGIIEINKEIVGFALGEPLNKSTFVIHFEKTDKRYKGLPAVMNQEFVAHECHEYKYVNREEDMGEPGLRASKLSYHPAFLVDKYYISF